MSPWIHKLFDDRYGAKGKYDVYRCRSCGFGRTNPILKPNEIGAFYAKHYPLTAATPESVQASANLEPRWLAWLTGRDNIAHQYAQSGQHVLDIGSASGVSLVEIQQLGAHAYGVEPDPTAVKLGKALGVRVHNGFITDPPYPKMQFDLVTASQVIEHAPDPREFLVAIRERLQPGGRAVLSFPNGNALYRTIFGRRWIHWHVPYHFNFFTNHSFRLLAKDAGFNVLRMRTITPNLWTIIQFRVLAETPKEGVMGALWSAQHTSNGVAIRPPFLIRAARYGALQIASALLTIFNRLIDAFGKGESFLVILEATE